jgi:hypothetical protein
MQQSPGAGWPKLPDKTYLSKNTFFLPVQLDDSLRANVQKIQLYVKDGPNGAWKLKDEGPANVQGFPCKLEKDGEYWFNLVTVDKNGRETPSDLRIEAPAVIVVMDTTGPQIDLKVLPPCTDGQCVRCEIRDANPNPNLIKFMYQTGDHQWRALEPMPGQPECFCLPCQAKLTGMVKVSCTDRAMNTTMKEFDLAAMGVNVAAPEVAVAPPPADVKPVHHEESRPPLPEPKFQDAAKVVPMQVEVQKDQKPQAAAPTAVAQDMPDLKQAPTPSGCDLAHQCKQPGASWLIVNQPRVSLQYRIDDSASGVGKVEVWITKDNGATWDMHCDDPDKVSPAVFDLPGEGVYGIRLVAYNLRGFTGNVPKPGDAPEYVVELDTTKPNAELASVVLGEIKDGNCVDITWVAEDKNLGQAPVDLYYSISPQGPWTAIAKNLPNSRHHRWYLPDKIGAQVYVRMVVTDMAGNSVRRDWTQAVVLDDGKRVDIHITGVVPAGQSNAVVPVINPTPPSGN